MKVTDEKKGLLVKLPGRDFNVLVDEEILGSKNLSYGISRIAVGSELPWHKHDGVEEIIFVLEGTGTAESRNESSSVQTGSILYMEPGSEHRVVNGGKSDMRLLCAFSPPVRIRPSK